MGCRVSNADQQRRSVRKVPFGGNKITAADSKAHRRRRNRADARQGWNVVWRIYPEDGRPIFTPASPRPGENSKPIKNLVGPEALEAMQRLVQRRELLIRDAADLFDGLDVLLIERIDDAADFLALRGQTDADRTAIDARALMIEEAELDELLQVV